MKDSQAPPEFQEAPFASLVRGERGAVARVDALRYRHVLWWSSNKRKRRGGAPECEATEAPVAPYAGSWAGI